LGPPKKRNGPVEGRGHCQDKKQVASPRLLRLELFFPSRQIPIRRIEHHAAASELDLENLPSVDGMDMFIRLDQSVESKFEQFAFLRETHDRAQSALMFFFQTKGDEARWRNDARLRAGLNEFYSIEDAAQRDFRLAGKNSTPPRIAESKSPVVHLMYILRHINVHTRPTPTRVQSIAVMSEWGGTAHEYSYGAVMLDAITVEDLERVREVRNYYSNEDLEHALEWLLEKQQIFGVSEVFRAGMNIYCREILDSLE
jgi:hypothetical protein